MDFASYPSLSLNLQSKCKRLATENFWIQDAGYDSCFFETCFLLFESLSTIQNVYIL